MKRALLILTATERAIFSARAATEGVHKSRLYPAGASLLGWAARHYGDFEKASDIFHSGKVRFSDALPLGTDGRVAYPMPKILTAQKGGAPAIDRDTRRLDSGVVWIGRTEFDDDPVNKTADEGRLFQPEGLSAGLLALSLHSPDPETGGRLRTATTEGRARTGALFGYTHLEPLVKKGRSGAADGDAASGVEDAMDGAKPMRYAATIEDHDDSLKDDDWQRLREALDRQTLLLGRASATGYGGWYACEWRDEGTSGFVNPWAPLPETSSRADETLVRVWALSDIALLDGWGMPDFAPGPKAFGLPEGGALDGGESAVTLRRFSPWNNKLGSRDVERMVIEAGSVLTYRYAGGGPRESLKTVGLWREQGLGRVWIDPPLLRASKPVAAASVLAIAGADHTPGPAGGAEASFDVLNWASRMAEAADPQNRNDLLKRWRKDLDSLLDRADGDGPSRSQWQKAATEARRAGDHTGIMGALFDGHGAACGKDGAATRRNDWGAGPDGGGTVRQWLRQRIEAERETPPARIAWALDQLAKHAARGRREKERGRG